MSKHAVETSVHGGLNSYKYEPLDLLAKKPSIRLAALLAGPRSSSVRLTLHHATFAERPRYEALSYTWGKPDDMKAIELDGIRVMVRANLWSALKHIRYTDFNRILWIDYLCINQANLEERNHQVKLMAYIYMRAERVLVWLGPTPANESVSTLPEFDSRELMFACNHPYWRRLWIVQEIGAATELMVFRGWKSVPWNDFFQAIQTGQREDVQPALRLWKQREGRHGDKFNLANLIEACEDSQCEEPRDKIYGFVGIAHDCQDDILPVDYSKSLFELYKDVIIFENYLALPTKIPESARVITLERKKSIVHFSQLIQKVLGGSTKMQQDFAKISPHLQEPFPPPSTSTGSDTFSAFTSIGVHSGNISIIGPSFSAVTDIPESIRKWKIALLNCESNIEALRRKNEGFMRVMFTMKPSDLAKIYAIEPHFSWIQTTKHTNNPLGSNTNKVKETKPSELNPQPQFVFGPDPSPPPYFTSNEPRLFLTRKGIMGLMPPNAQAGDEVWQFRNTDVVVIMRLVEEQDQAGSKGTTQHRRIVGRAVVANNKFMEENKFQVPEQSRVTGLDFDGDGEELFMDMRTLQLLTQSF